MSASPSPQSAPRRSTSLAMLATIFAIVFGLAFGLCSVGALTVLPVNQSLGSNLIGISIAIEALCLVGLLVIGIIALVRASRSR